jgi:hypothetical protein
MLSRLASSCRGSILSRENSLPTKVDFGVTRRGDGPISVFWECSEGVFGFFKGAWWIGITSVMSDEEKRNGTEKGGCKRIVVRDRIIAL